MAPPSSSQPDPSPPDGSGSVLWTLLVGSALVALVFAPRQARGRVPARAKEPRLRPDEGAHSHEGRTAELVAATQGDRGRNARGPHEIGAAGWRDIGLRVFREFLKDRVLSVAAGVTFYTLLSLFPALAALVSCYGLFADVGVINDHLATLQGVVPSGAIEIIGDQVKRIAAKGGGSLSITFFTSLLISLWSANAAMKAMFDALNVVYEEEEKRSFVMLNVRSLTFTVGALVFVVLALTCVVVLPVVFAFVGISGGAWLIALLRWPALLLAMLGALSVLYRYGPSRRKARWRWVGFGSVVAGVLWLVGSLLFSWYVSSFGNYNETYGSLGAVIGFMTWIWISATIVLLGGEINAEIEHQTAQDTTTRPGAAHGGPQGTHGRHGGRGGVDKATSPATAVHPISRTDQTSGDIDGRHRNPPARGPQRRRLAPDSHPRAVSRPARARHGARGHQLPARREAARHFRLRRLRHAAFRLRHEVRIRHGLAEFFRPSRRGRRNHGGPQPLDGAHGGPLRPLQGPSRACLRRRPGAHRLALLHERRRPSLRPQAGVTPGARTLPWPNRLYPS